MACRSHLLASDFRNVCLVLEKWQVDGEESLRGSYDSTKKVFIGYSQAFATKAGSLSLLGPDSIA